MTLSLKQRAEEIALDIIKNSESWWLGVDEIILLCKEVREESIRECVEIANNWMDSVGELPQSETFMTAEGIRNHILLRLLPPPKTGKP